MENLVTPMSHCLPSACDLHQYLTHAHWTGHALIGPDPGIRINYRIGRFVKSYLRKLQWLDSLYYVQGQAYWILANWRLFDLTGEVTYREIAVACSDYLLERQREDGAWEYPNPEWKGRVATTEGNWGSVGLLESFRQTSDERYLDSALDWHRFLTKVTGFQRDGDELAVNYFANRGKSSKVCNNSVTTLRVLAEMNEATGNDQLMEPFEGLLRFLERAQLESGEFPYVIAAEPGVGRNRTHFQCFQYNAFECLNLMRTYELTANAALLQMISKSLAFLQKGQADDGRAMYQCGNPSRTVNYHTAVLAAALSKANDFNVSGYVESARRSFQYLLSLQRTDGSFPYSQREYKVLSDQRSYPRYLAMILYHLLHSQTVNVPLSVETVDHSNAN